MIRLLHIAALLSLFIIASQILAQEDAETKGLGLPGDNLDLYATLDLFQKSKTIEDFEKSLNLESTGINNLDLNLDGQVDFIKVVTEQNEDDFTFILQVAVNKTENQDVAVIFISKDEKVQMQMVGDPDLYGADYIVELEETPTESVTANPAYKGSDTVKVVNKPATTTTVIVESTPIVQYVYSPAYVPYYPPYYYGYYPPYYRPFPVVSFSLYIGFHAHYHRYGYGYRGNTVVIHNRNTYNRYSSNRTRSTTVNRNHNNGNYNRPSNGNRPSTRPGNGAGTNRPSNGATTRPGNGATTRPGNGAGTNRPSNGATTRPGNGAGTNRPSGGGSTRPVTRPATTPSRQPSNQARPQSRPSAGGASRYNRGSASPARGGGGMSRGGGAMPRGGGGRRR